MRYPEFPRRARDADPSDSVSRAPAGQLPPESLEGFRRIEAATAASAASVPALDLVTTEESRKRRGARSLIFETVSVVVLAVLLAVGLHVFVTQVYAISGHSMEPTLSDGERVVIHKLKFVDLERGDIVIFTSPRDPRKNLIKRVIGLPGDWVEVTNKGVRVNGEYIDETYIRQDLYPLTRDPVRVPDDTVYVLGDNRPQSQDSRHFDSIPVESIKGSVFLRLWPLDAFTSF